MPDNRPACVAKASIDAISVTNRYFTSLRSIRSQAKSILHVARAGAVVDDAHAGPS